MLSLHLWEDGSTKMKEINVTFFYFWYLREMNEKSKWKDGKSEKKMDQQNAIVFKSGGNYVTFFGMEEILYLFLLYPRARKEKSKGKYEKIE